MINLINGWKTRIFAALVGVLGLVTVLDPNMIVDIVGKENQGYVFVGIAVATYVLRQFTTTPAGESEKMDG